MRYEIKPQNLGKYEAKLARELPKSLKRAREKAARKAIATIQARIHTMPMPPIDRKRYLNGWQVSSPRWGSIAIQNVTPYAQVIETGRRRGARMPPIRAIEGWVIRKLGVKKIHARGVAIAVAKSISRRGIRGRHVLLAAMPTISNIYLAETQSRFERLLGPEGHR
jgi:hypothetical protein